MPLLGLWLAACPAKLAAPPPGLDAGVAASQRVPAQSKPTPEWDVDFFAVDVVGMVVRLRHVEVVSVGPVRDEDVLPGLEAGTIPDTTRTTFSDGSRYTVSLHKVAKRPYIASLDLKGERSIEQADENLDGLRDSVRETRVSDWLEVSWRSTRAGGRFNELTTQEVIQRDGDRLTYLVSKWTDADGDGQWTLGKTFQMSNVSN
ncbi:MAG: hypothetical protein IT380_24925 [Myxococcales bacterium]|nr:hypothetical protein [Myxococcales bacterium]